MIDPAIARARAGDTTEDRAVCTRAPRRALVGLVQAYIFTQACSFLQPFRHNFTGNGRQDLKMI
jgi:hypothetical protein